MPPEETPALVAASDEAVVHHVHRHSPSSPVITGHRDHKRKRRSYSVNGDLLPQKFTAAWSSTINAGRGGTEPAAPTGGAHRSQRRAPAAGRTTDAGGSSSKAIRVKHSSSSFVIGGGGKQHPGMSPGCGGHSYYASNHAAAAPSSSKRPIVLGPAAPPPPQHLPAKARRPPSAPEPSVAVPLKRVDDDGECFRRGVEVFREWDAATQQAAVNRFVSQQQSPPEGDVFSFWLTPEEAEADLIYVYRKVEEAQRTSKAASGSGTLTRHEMLR